MVEINSFIGGLSDTDSRVSAGQFPYAENMEVMKRPEYTTLAFKPIEVLDTTAVAKRMYCSVYAKTGILDNLFFMGQDGRVVETDSGNTVLSSTYDITACVQYKISGTDYILRAYDAGSNGYLGQISVTDAYNSTDWTLEGSYNATYKTIESGTGPYQMLIFNNTLYVSGGADIDRLSGTGNYERVLEMQNTIVGMTDNGSHIRLYTDDGRMHIWDGGSNSPETSIDTGISNIRAAYGTGQQDWVVGGEDKNSSILYMSNGYAYPIYKRGTDLGAEYDISRTKYDIFQGNGNKQCILDHQGMYWVTEDNSIGQYGKRYPSSPFAYNRYCTTASNGEEITTVSALLKKGNSLYYFRESATGEGIDRLIIDSSLDSGDSTFQPAGFVYSPKFMMGNIERIAFELYIRADVPTSTTMVVKYSIDGSGTRSTLDTITATTDKRHILSLEQEFFEIQFKFEFTTSDATVTPSFYDYSFTPGPLRREGQS